MRVRRDCNVRQFVDGLHTERGKRVAVINLVRMARTNDPDYNALAAPILEKNDFLLEAAEAYEQSNMPGESMRCYEGFVAQKSSEQFPGYELISVLENKLGKKKEAREKAISSINAFLSSDKKIETIENGRKIREIALRMEDYELVDKINEKQIENYLHYARNGKIDFAYNVPLTLLAQKGDSRRIIQLAEEAISKFPNSRYLPDWNIIKSDVDKFIEEETSVKLEKSYYKEDKGLNDVVESEVQDWRQSEKNGHLESKEKNLASMIDEEQKGNFCTASMYSVRLGMEKVARSQIAVGLLLETNIIQEAKGICDLIGVEEAQGNL